MAHRVCSAFLLIRFVPLAGGEHDASYGRLLQSLLLLFFFFSVREN